MSRSQNLCALALIVSTLSPAALTAQSMGKQMRSNNFESEEALRREREEKKGFDVLSNEEKKAKAIFLLTLQEDGTITASATNVQVQKVKGKKETKQISFQLDELKDKVTCEFEKGHEAVVIQLSTGKFHCSGLAEA